MVNLYNLDRMSKFVSTFIFKRTSSRTPIGVKSGSKPPYDSCHHPGVTLDRPSMVLVSKTETQETSE